MAQSISELGVQQTGMHNRKNVPKEFREFLYINAKTPTDMTMCDSIQYNL